MAQNVVTNDFTQEVLNSKLPVLVDFWAPWCGPCQTISPVVEDISQNYASQIKVCKINVDEASEIATQFAIMSIPALMIFKEGKVMEKRVGAMDKDSLEKFIRPYVA